MAKTFHSYNAPATYSFSFPSYQSSDVKVRVDGVLKTAGTHYDINGYTTNGGGTVVFIDNSGSGGTNHTPSSGVVRIYRDTNVSTSKATFTPGSSIKAADLTNNTTQLLYRAQEEQEDFDPNSPNLLQTYQIEDNAITNAKVADNAIENANVKSDAAIDGAKINPNFGNQTIRTSNNLLFSGSSSLIQGVLTVNGRNITNDGNKLDGIEAGAKADQSAADIRALVQSANDSNVFTDDDHTKLDGIEDNATADQTAEEIQDIVGAMVSGNTESGITVTYQDSDGTLDFSVASQTDQNFTNDDHTKLDGIEDNATADQTNAEIRAAVEAATDSNVFTDDDHTKLDGIEDNADVTDATNVNAAGAVMNSDTTTASMQFVLDEDDFSSDSSTKVPTQQSTKAYITATSQPLDSDLTTLAGMQSGTASKLASSTALTADIADLNQIDGLTKQTTISDSDASFPTSGAVVDYVAAQIAPIGGLEVIADEDNFPSTQPEAGVVISIADTGGIVVNGSGVSTNCRTAGNGSDNVTINGINSAFYNKTVDAGVSFMVSSTGSSQTYDFHKATLKEADILNLSNDINDFGNRYRVNAGEPSSNNDEGDLVYDTNANKMKVYDSTASAWKEVTSTGEFKQLFLCPAGGSGAPTINGSIATYDLKESSNTGSAATVTTAAQLLVSVNGVIQKPNLGTSAPSEGFALVYSNTIIFGANLQTGDSVFIVQIGSAVSLPVPGDDSVNADKIQNGVITNEKISTTAAIAGTKISPDFGSQDLTTTGKFITNSSSSGDYIRVYASSGTGKWDIYGNGANLRFSDNDSAGSVVIDTNLDVGAGIDVTGDATVSGGQLRLGTADTASGHINSFEVMTFNIDSDNDDTNRYFAFYKDGNSGSGTEIFRIQEDGRVGINDSTPLKTLDITGEDGGNGEINVKRTSGATCFIQAQAAAAVFGSSSNHITQLKSNGTTAVTIDTSQRVGIGTTDPEGKGLEVANSRTNAYGATSDNRNLAHLICRNGSDAAGRFASISMISGGGTQAEGSINLVQTGDYAGDLTFKLRSAVSTWAEAMRITSAGKIQIQGTRSGNLQTNDDDSLQLYTKSTSADINRGTGITFYTHDGSGYEMGGTIQVAKENGTADDPASYMRFSTQTGSTTSEHVRIHSSGLLDANTSYTGTYSATTSISPHLRARNQQGADNIYGGLQLRADRGNGAAAIVNIACINSSTSYESTLAFQSRNTDGNFTEKLRIQPAGGISFNGDTAASNALDDYEEGTHSPTMTNLDVPSHVTVDHFNYTKIGRLVHFNAKFTVSSSINDVSGFGFSLPFDQAGSRENVFTAISDRSGSDKDSFAFVLNANQSNAYGKELEGFSNPTYNSFSGNVILVTGTYEST